VQVMTPKPECVGLDTTLVDALHTMHDGKFLNLPVVNQGNALVLHFMMCDCIMIHVVSDC
jgi:CBS domain-containing protein